MRLAAGQPASFCAAGWYVTWELTSCRFRSHAAAFHLTISAQISFAWFVSFGESSVKESRNLILHLSIHATKELPTSLAKSLDSAARMP
jgi:hypothetical protein